jgi:hypothetical protein
LSSPLGSVTSRSSVPGTKSKTTVRFTCAVPPLALTATTLRTVVPPVTATERLKAPLESAIVEALVVAEFASVFVAAT